MRSRNAVTNRGAPDVFSLPTIVEPGLHRKRLLAVNSQRHATLTQQAVWNLAIKTSKPLL